MSYSLDGGVRLSIEPNGDVQIDNSGTMTLAGAAQLMARADQGDAAIAELRTKQGCGNRQQFASPTG